MSYSGVVVSYSGVVGRLVGSSRGVFCCRSCYRLLTTATEYLPNTSRLLQITPDYSRIPSRLTSRVLPIFHQSGAVRTHSGVRLKFLNISKLKKHLPSRSRLLQSSTNKSGEKRPRPRLLPSNLPNSVREGSRLKSRLSVNQANRKKEVGRDEKNKNKVQRLTYFHFA